MPGRTSSKPKAEPKAEKTKIPRTITIPPLNMGYLLVAVIIIGAFVLGFVIGVLVTKVHYLEKGATTATGTATDTTAASPDITTPVKVDPGHLPAQGDANAKVKIIEFADLRCPFCEQFYKEVEPQIKKDYVDTGKAVFYFRHYAFLGDASTLAANGAECANAQGKFWEFHNYMYDHQPDESDTSMYTVDNLSQIAGTLGMDSAAFSSCLTDKTYQKNVDKDLSEGQAAGVQGTPATFINGMLFSGACPYTNFKQAIDFAAAGTPFKISGADGCTVTAQ